MFILYDEKFLDAMRDRLKASAESLTPKALAIRTFIILRRHARNVVQLEEAWRSALRSARRAMPLAQKHGAAQDVWNVNSWQEEACVQLKNLKQIRIEIGDKLTTVIKWIEHELTLTEQYDLLNINSAHRNWPSDEMPALFDLVMVHGLEDSADRHGKDILDGALIQCLNASMMNFMRTNPKGRAIMDFMTDELFSPGGLFGEVSLYRQLPDGTMEEVPASERTKPPAGSTIH